MPNLRLLSLIAASISFIVVIGGAVYEHLSIVPVWTSAVPASLAMFQGQYAIQPSHFWIPIHPITIVLLLAALVLNWGTERRKYILVTLGGYVLVLVTTFLFFVPELMALTQSAYSNSVNSDLTNRAKLWETLSLFRLGFLLILAIVAMLGISRSEKPGVLD